MSLSFDLKTLTGQVGYCLRNYPATRNSDITLLIHTWDEFYSEKVHGDSLRTNERFVYIRDLYNLPREDAVKRVRADFNARGMFYPTEWKIAEQRGINEDEWRNVMGYPAKILTDKPSRGESYMDPQRKEVATTQKLL